MLPEIHNFGRVGKFNTVYLSYTKRNTYAYT